MDVLPRTRVKRIADGKETTVMSLLVAKRTGMTRTLYDSANKRPDKTLILRGAIEGPYGGMHQLESYGTALLFAGGIGITHQLGYVRELIHGYQEHTAATRKITLVWVVRSIHQVHWIEPYMKQILAMDKRRDILKVLVYITRPTADVTQISPSGSIELRPGRPDFDKIMTSELDESIGAVCATVCGPGQFQDSVRDAVRKNLHLVHIDFVEESFTW